MGLGRLTRLMSGWAVNFFDYDNDGNVDLFIANGHPDDQIESLSSHVSYKEPLLLFHNNSRTLESVSAVIPPHLPGPNRTNWDGLLTGRAFSSTAFVKLKIAVFAPIPSASVRTATAVKPGLRSMRAAKCKSCQHVSTRDCQPAARTISFATSRFPVSNRTSRSASLRFIPRLVFSSAAISRKPRTSSSDSPSTRSLRNSDRSPPAMLRSNDTVRLRRLQDSGDHPHLPSPFPCFAVEPLSL